MNKEALEYFIQKIKSKIDPKAEYQWNTISFAVEGLEEHPETTTDAEFKIIGNSLIVTEMDEDTVEYSYLIEINKIIFIEEI